MVGQALGGSVNCKEGEGEGVENGKGGPGAGWEVLEGGEEGALPGGLGWRRQIKPGGARSLLAAATPWETLAEET